METDPAGVDIHTALEIIVQTQRTVGGGGGGSLAAQVTVILCNQFSTTGNGEKGVDCLLYICFCCKVIFVALI